MGKLSVEILLETRKQIRHIVSVKPSDSVLFTAEVLKKNDVGLVLVIENEQLKGVVSEKDLVQRWICSSRFPQPISVEEIMSREVEYVTVFEDVQDCYLRFVAKNCRHLPVLDPGGKVIGVLSLRNVADYIVNELQINNTK